MNQETEVESIETLKIEGNTQTSSEICFEQDTPDQDCNENDDSNTTYDNQSFIPTEDDFQHQFSVSYSQVFAAGLQSDQDIMVGSQANELQDDKGIKDFVEGIESSANLERREIEVDDGEISEIGIPVCQDMTEVYLQLDEEDQSGDRKVKEDFFA
jgi:hypothetical protein